jgi:hypothetical protein
MPHGQQPGTPPPPGMPPGYDWRYASPPHRRSRAMAAAVAVAIVLAVVALVLGMVNLTPPSPGASARSTSAPTSTAPADTTAADRALCNAIAPLMAEDDRVSNAFIDSGKAGSPERDAAIPKYRSDTEDWAGRLQHVLNGHQDADPFFKRTLQRFIDDRILLVRNMRPGPAKPYDEEAWSDSMTAYEGPISVCRELGVKW